VRTPSIDRASSTRRAAWLLAGAAALSAAPAACSHDAPGTAAEKDAPPATPELDAASRAKLTAIRARFPGALAVNEGVQVRDDAAADLIQIDLPASAKRAATLYLPRRADGAIHLTDASSHLQIAFSLEGAAPTRAAIDGGVVLYAGAAPGGGDVIHVPSAAGTEDLIHFDRAPAKEQLSYRVDVSRAAGLRLFAGTLELLDAAGTPLLRVAPPYVLDAEGRRHEAELALDGCAADTDARAPFGRPVTSPGAAFCTVRVDWHAAHVTYPALVDPVWGSTFNNLVTPRLRHTITLLNPSDVKSLALLAGGFATVGGAALKSAEIYDPLSRRFTPTGLLAVARGSHTATLLSKVAKPIQFVPADPVLVAGGADSAGTPLATLEIYDPATGLFQTDPAPMAFPRFGHSATLFADRTVLLAGGTTLPLNQPTPTATIYAFTSLVGGVLTSTVTSTASQMKNSRTGLASARLGTGQVLLTGGFVLAGGSLQALQSAEIYDPTTDAFLDITPANNGIALMAIQRGGHTATPIGNGLILIAGGTTNTVAGTFPTAIDIYSDGSLGGVTGFLDPGSLGNLTTGRASHTATLLASGDVLVAGGFNGGSSISAAEVFATKTKTFSPLGALVPMAARGDHAALLVNAGDSIGAGHTVLVTGGTTSSTNGATALATAQILHNDNGDPCTIADECVSGFCADGVCCNTACDAECYACSTATQEANGKNVNGTCGFAIEGSDPRFQCINELEVHTQCDGKGSTEQVGTTKDCKPGTCGANGLCSTTCSATTDCSLTGFCDKTIPNAGVCSPRRIDSTICAADEECINGHCVDGLCCDLACDGQCQACDVPGFPGKCTAFGTESTHEQPHPNDTGMMTATKPRAACDGIVGGKATSCTGYCVGAMDPIHCQDPGASKTLQGTTCADVAGAASKLTSYPCDGKGTNTEVASDCGGFLCADATSCKTACAADTECLPDFVCTDKTCQALTGPLCDGGNILRRPAAQGGNTPCADHYTCPALATACRTDCDSVNDCVDGLVCNGDRKCVTRPAAAVITACNVGQPGDAPPRPLPWTLGLAALAALAIFRRRTI
jgi:MYXO-CTERM domain-containing protein